MIISRLCMISRRFSIPRAWGENIIMITIILVVWRKKPVADFFMVKNCQVVKDTSSKYYYWDNRNIGIKLKLESSKLAFQRAKTTLYRHRRRAVLITVTALPSSQISKILNGVSNQASNGYAEPPIRWLLPGKKLSLLALTSS